MSEAAAAPLRRLGLTVQVRPNGVEWPVEPATTELHDPPVVGTLGLLTAWKGYGDLLDAVALVPAVRLELAGGAFAHDADYVDGLRRRAAAPDLAGRVRFLGRTADPLATMRGWDVFVSASTSPEAGPMTVVEAMSLGRPVVATDHGGPRDYLADGRGELVPARRPGVDGGRHRAAADRRRSPAPAGRGRPSDGGGAVRPSGHAARPVRRGDGTVARPSA